MTRMGPRLPAGAAAPTTRTARRAGTGPALREFGATRAAERRLEVGRCAGGRGAPPPARLLCVAAAAVVLDGDLLAGDVLGHGALLRLDVLVEAHALLRHDALLGDRLLGVEDDLVLLLGQLRPVHRGIDVRVGDRLALEAHLLPLDRDGLLDLLGHDVLLQARPAGLALARADGELLLRAGHRVVGRRARDVVADGRGAAERPGRARIAAHVRVTGRPGRVVVVPVARRDVAVARGRAGGRRPGAGALAQT